MQEQYSVGVYARLSRDDERTGESVSIENQKEMLARDVREQGWTLYDYYCDDGLSCTTFDRPGFNRLVQDATDHKINLVLTKNLSRLGRDYIEAGKYTDFIFPSLGCRFIALNDGVDTIRKNNEMLVILKNVMNDLYARDTSNKIKAVKLSTFKAGKYVGCYAPLSYRKSAVDKHILEIDPVSAPVVRHIFDLRLQGNGFRKIALILNAEIVPAPRTFYYMAEGRENHRGETPFWNDVTVKTILRNEVYLGHMVQNKTGTVSYKNHKQVSKPESEWIRVENTHEPLISPEVWDALQRIDNPPPPRQRAQRQKRHRLFIRRSAPVHGLRFLHAVYAGLPQKGVGQGTGVQGICLQPVRFGRQKCLFFPLHQSEGIDTNRTDGHPLQGDVGRRTAVKSCVEKFSRRRSPLGGKTQNTSSGVEHHRPAVAGV